ncbi:hypothetical protein ACBP93_10275 [Paenalcaligenes hominis]|uniref:hypothetical protein n=1 Tax=Paenalcaligenes hominis TaxID=643674 RepID=UPI0035249F07
MYFTRGGSLWGLLVNRYSTVVWGVLLSWFVLSCTPIRLAVLARFTRSALNRSSVCMTAHAKTGKF